MNTAGNVLLDTSVVVGYLRQDPTLHRKIDQVNDVYLPLVVLGELLYGAHKSTQKSKMVAQVKAFASGCILILPNEATADFYGQIKAELSVAGKSDPPK
jgi:tRNA(fMet)-specific endonuclease VapC